MTIIEALILGIVQGITEFLPVSSSGHTIIVGKLLGLSAIPLEFELVVHLGTLFAVIISLKNRIIPLIKKPFCKTTGLIIVGSIPTAIIFLVFKDFFEASFDGHLLVYCFLITSALIVISEFVALAQDERLVNTPKKMGFVDAIIIGIFQGAAALPGISRSGATVSAAMMLKNTKKESLEFSFLLSIPVILGSFFLELVFKSGSIGVPFINLLCGFISAFISGLLGLKLIKLLLFNRSLNGFAVYLFILSLFLIVNESFLHLF